MWPKSMQSRFKWTFLGQMYDLCIGQWAGKGYHLSECASIPAKFTQGNFSCSLVEVVQGITNNLGSYWLAGNVAQTV